ncbi:MAG TPA: hypothetical protein VF039_14390 [Longimicrobiales bacterium]
MEKRREPGLLPIPEHRRKRTPILLGIGVVALAVGLIMDVGFLQGLGIGLLAFTALALLADRWARRRTHG